MATGRQDGPDLPNTTRSCSARPGEMRGSQGEKRTMKWLFVLNVLVAVALAANVTRAQEPGPGDAAPPFELPGSDGNTHALADYAGKTVVIAWFPMAFTGG